MIRLLLIVAFLIGSPRDIANRPVKHGKVLRVKFPKVVKPKAVPVKVLDVALTPPTPKWVDWGCDNSNTNTLDFIVETKTNLTAPWQTYSRGTVAPLQMIVFRVYKTNRMQFFRAGFVWP